MVIWVEKIPGGWHPEGKRPLPSRQPRNAAAAERRRGAIVYTAGTACGYGRVVWGLNIVLMCERKGRIDGWGIMLNARAFYPQPGYTCVRAR